MLLAGDASGQPALFEPDEIVAQERGSGRLAGLEITHVLARRIINPIPPGGPVSFRWSINAYRGCSHACVYCFARPTHEYLGLNGGSDFDRKIIVKINAVERLRAELDSPKWRGESIAMGTNTDPYQRAEGKYRLTRGIVSTLVERANPFSILTKSALIVRDKDLLVRAYEQSDVSISFSIGTVDEDVWRVAEPGTPPPARRLAAVRELTSAGIDVGVLVAPILPGISDRRDQLERTVSAIVAAGGTVHGTVALYLDGATRTHYLSWLAARDPVLHARYLDRYAGRTHLPDEYSVWIRRVVAEAVERAGGRPMRPFPIRPRR